LPEPGVLIAHPTRQHSHRLAQALHRQGWLQGYWTLLPDERALTWIPRFVRERLPSAIQRHSLRELPRERVHVLLGPLIAQKLASRFSNVGVRLLGELIAWAAFDHWVALQLPKQRPRVVVGYEMCCAETFRVAKSIGILCVLDAAAFHYSLQDQVLEEDSLGKYSWAGRKLRARKRDEFSLADKIICVSKLALMSYVAHGVSADKLLLNQVGCDVSQFEVASHVSSHDVAKFIFIGIPCQRKGFDLLHKAYLSLVSKFPNAELHVAGDTQLASKILGKSLSSIHCHGKLSHGRLVKLLSRMDCLVLPSRLESFGMVVVEALAAGVPVIVSDHVGAAEAVRQGENGWVIPAGDADALYQRMSDCCRSIEQTRLMTATCTESAREYDWSHYSRRAVEIFSPLLRGVL